jgi:hypothetical protein
LALPPQYQQPWFLRVYLSSPPPVPSPAARPSDLGPGEEYYCDDHGENCRRLTIKKPGERLVVNVGACYWVCAKGSCEAKAGCDGGSIGVDGAGGEVKDIRNGKMGFGFYGSGGVYSAPSSQRASGLRLCYFEGAGGCVAFGKRADGSWWGGWELGLGVGSAADGKSVFDLFNPFS